MSEEMATCMTEWKLPYGTHPGLPHICANLLEHQGKHRCKCDETLTCSKGSEATMSYEPGREPQAPDTLGLIIHDGHLSFDPDCTDDPNLRSWLDNVAPQDVMLGWVRIEIPMKVYGWGDGGPILHVGDELEGGDDE